MLVPALSMDHFTHCDIILRLITHEFSCSQFATSLCCNLRPSHCLFWKIFQMLRWRFRTFQRGSLLSRMCHHGWGTTIQGLEVSNNETWRLCYHPMETIGIWSVTVPAKQLTVTAKLSKCCAFRCLQNFCHFLKIITFLMFCDMYQNLRAGWQTSLHYHGISMLRSKWLTFGWTAAVSFTPCRAVESQNPPKFDMISTWTSHFHGIIWDLCMLVLAWFL